MCELVSENAPRVFAVVQEYGLRVDARIAAWGIAFEDRAEVVAVEENLRMRVSSPEAAVRFFHLGTRVRARLVWPETVGNRTVPDRGEGTVPA
ncbi:hypothetical protein [Actinopolyspora mortivallis]|uniref:hypothetical protein n=1 Tax=Actinopolyspora mortivallis TaxID=33906 RepID=UPI002158ABDB|nr:hypothetical protein [Actinopolyspora mortivallis]